MVYRRGGDPKWKDYQIICDGKTVADWIAVDDERWLVVAYESNFDGKFASPHLMVLYGKAEVVKVEAA